MKINYNECLTNLACSIQKYFGIETKHSTLEYVDIILEENKPKNVVTILFDGMGAKILAKTLNSNDFFIKNKLKNITTVFPATTTAATTSIRTGLNPIEHGWLGWNMYIAPINKTITLFRNCEKGKLKTVDKDFLTVKNKLYNKTIINEINEIGKYKAIELFPFGENKYSGLEEMLDIIKRKCKEKGKKYIYAYDDEPDYTMHDFGPNSDEVKKLIKERNNKVEKLCNDLEDTIIFIIADHGHKLAENILLKDYPEIIKMLERTTSLEQRAVSFKIKEGYKQQFIEEFNKNFGKDFKLYSKQEVINNNLFGDGKENELVREAIGDFIAITENSGKCLITDGDDILKSQHAGLSDEEIFVPLIVINRCKK